MPKQKERSMETQEAMIEIAICEDAAEDSALLTVFIKEEMELLHQKFRIDCFSGGEALLAAIENGAGYHLLLLDIYMKQINGVETAKAARRPDVCLAFLTSSREYALDAFSLDALHYLVKPFGRADIRLLLRRFFARTQRPMELFEIHSDFKTYSFPLLQTEKIQSSRKGVDVYLKGQDIPQHIPLSFARLEEQLDPQHFLRISRGLIVHMSFIRCIDGDTCRFRDGTESLISRREKAEVRRKYNDYLFSRSQKGADA